MIRSNSKKTAPGIACAIAATALFFGGSLGSPAFAQDDTAAQQSRARIDDSSNQTRTDRVNPATAGQQDSGYKSGATPGANTAALTASDKAFIGKARQSSENEIARAQLAQQQTTQADVRQFAQQLEQDHSQLIRKLDGLDTSAVSNSTAASSTESTMPMANDERKEQEALAELRAKSGQDFAKSYADIEVNRHQDSIDSFTEVIENSAYSPSVRQLAQQTLPTLRNHEQMARNLQQTYKD